MDHHKLGCQKVYTDIFKQLTDIKLRQSSVRIGIKENEKLHNL